MPFSEPSRSLADIRDAVAAIEQFTKDMDFDAFREDPAAVRFLSIEPLLEDLGTINLTGIHWVIVVGESGPGARPMQAAWVTSLRDQCAAARIPFFFKQWGGVQKKKTGRILAGRTYDEQPLRTTQQSPPHRQTLLQQFEERASVFAM